MATGDVVGAILQSLPPSATRANPGVRAGGSTPGEYVSILSYDDTADEYWDFLCALEGYASGGLDVELPWMSEDQIIGNVQWEVAIRAIPDDAEDIDTSHSYQFNTVVATTASAAGEFQYSTVSFTDGADMDSAADGERFILRVKRDGSNTSGNDTMTNDAQLVWPAIIIREA